MRRLLLIDDTQNFNCLSNYYPSVLKNFLQKTNRVSLNKRLCNDILVSTLVQVHSVIELNLRNLHIGHVLSTFITIPLHSTEKWLQKWHLNLHAQLHKVYSR